MKNKEVYKAEAIKLIVFSDLSKDATYPAVIHWFDDDTKIHLISKDVYNFKNLLKQLVLV